MENLPLDIVLNILSRLPVASLFHCKCVCKAWHDLAHDPLLPCLHKAYHDSLNNPCLILQSFTSTSHQHCLYLVDNCIELNEDEVFDDYHDKGVVKRILLPFECSSFSSVLHYNGLLCLYHVEVHHWFVDEKISIYNPFTKQLTNLPDHTMMLKDGVAYGFGFHPRTREYKVVRIVERECVVYNYDLNDFRPSLEQSVEVFTLGTDSWKQLKANSPFWLEMQPPEALVNGALHWVGQVKQVIGKIIVAFDLSNEQFRQIPSPVCRLDECKCRLMVLGGCLSVVVYYNCDKLDIWLMKDYGVESSWTKKCSIFKQDVGIKGYIRPLCLLKNGKILLECNNSALFSYDPETQSCKNIRIGDLPNVFQAVPHVQSNFSALQ